MFFAAVGAHSDLPYGSAMNVQSAFAAMAGNSATIGWYQSRTPALSTIVFNGTADSTVHPTKSRQIAQNARQNGPSQTIETETTGEGAGRTLTCTVTIPFEGATAVDHWVIEGLGHAWAGDNRRFVTLTDHECDFIVGVEKDEEPRLKGRPVIGLGEQTDGIMVLKSGWTVVHADSSDGRSQILRVYLPCEVMGMAKVSINAG